MPENDDQIKYVRIDKIRQEPGAKELTESPDMEPYLDFIKARMQGFDGRPELDLIRQLPLERRYIWRIVSSLKWGFADFDSETVKIDLATMTPDDLRTTTNLLRFRPAQFCMFLKTIAGAEQMEQIMLQAIANAKK